MEDDMPFIGFKASESMVKKLDEVAKRKGVGRSELIRDLIRNNLDTTDDFSNWKVYAWNLFGINNDQLRYAMGTSETAEEFFSIISKWSKNIKI
jgi:metal-responsive CopG/Arc/MetJ family transcriptional regulator